MDAHRHPPLHQDSANEHDDGNVSFDGASPLGNFPSSVAASSTSDAPPPDHLQHQSHSPLPPQRSSHSPNPPPSSQHPLHPPNSTLNGDAGGLRQGAFASSLGQQPSSSASTNAVGGGEGSNRSSISSDGAPDLSAVGRVLGDGEEAQVPRLGKVRCYWALLTSQLDFLYLDPVLQHHMGVEHHALLGTSLFDYLHPDELNQAKEDLRTIVDGGTLFGSVTRVRFARLSRIRQILGCAAPEIPTDAHLFVADEHYLALDLVLNLAGEGMVLAFFHAVVNKDPVADSDERNKSEWTSWCGTPFINQEMVRLLWSQAAKVPLPPPSSVPALPPSRVFQILLASPEHDILLSHPPARDASVDRTTLPMDGSYWEEDYQKLLLEVSLNPQGRSQFNEAKTTCTRRFRAKHNLDSEGCYRVIESVYIPYGTLIFACFVTTNQQMNHQQLNYMSIPPQISYPSPPQVVKYPSPPQIQASPYPPTGQSQANLGLQNQNQPHYSPQPPYAPPSAPFLPTASWQHPPAGVNDPPDNYAGWSSSAPHAGARPTQRSSSSQPHKQSSPNPSRPPIPNLNNLASVLQPPSDGYNQAFFPPSPHDNNDPSIRAGGSSSTSNKTIPAYDPAGIVPEYVVPLARPAKKSNRGGSGGGSRPASGVPKEASQLRNGGKPPKGVQSCVSCGMTDSPEWRKGASGNKDLCNACGLRYARLLAKQSGKLKVRPKKKKNPDETDAAPTFSSYTEPSAAPSSTALTSVDGKKASGSSRPPAKRPRKSANGSGNAKTTSPPKEAKLEPGQEPSPLAGPSNPSSNQPQFHQQQYPSYPQHPQILYPPPSGSANPSFSSMAGSASRSPQPNLLQQQKYALQQQQRMPQNTYPPTSYPPASYPSSSYPQYLPPQATQSHHPMYYRPPPPPPGYAHPSHPHQQPAYNQQQQPPQPRAQQPHPSPYGPGNGYDAFPGGGYYPAPSPSHPALQQPPSSSRQHHPHPPPSLQQTQPYPQQPHYPPSSNGFHPAQYGGFAPGGGGGGGGGGYDPTFNHHPLSSSSSSSCPAAPGFAFGGGGVGAAAAGGGGDGGAGTGGGGGGGQEDELHAKLEDIDELADADADADVDVDVDVDVDADGESVEG